MNTAELIRRWQERQLEILDALPADLRAEFLCLADRISAVQAEEARTALEKARELGMKAWAAGRAATARALAAEGEDKATESPAEKARREAEEAEHEAALEQIFGSLGRGHGEATQPRPKRLPLSLQKLKLIAFMQKHGPVPRSFIAANTNIPAGSLSVLLSEEEFEQVERGIWRLREEKKPRHADSTSK